MRSEHHDLYDYPRTRSLMSAGSRSQLDGLDDVTARTKSLRNWSMTSTTPTTSSASSNPFPRSRSNHTANTSLDLGHGFSVALNSSRSSINSVVFCPPSASSPGGLSSPGGNKPWQTPTGGFNIDDHISSDDDSFTDPRRPRGEGEGELQFSGGYGVRGDLLPGLGSGSPPRDEDAAVPPPISRSRSPRPTRSLPSVRQTSKVAAAAARPRLGTASSFSPVSRARGRRYIIDPATAADRSDDDYYSYRSGGSDFGGSDGDVLSSMAMALAPPPQQPWQQRHSVIRISALGGGGGSGSYNNSNGNGVNSFMMSGGGGGGGGPSSCFGDDVIEEERFEKVDIATAVRLRKEAKARQRAGPAAPAPRRRAASARAPPLPRHESELDEEACLADVE